MKKTTLLFALAALCSINMSAQSVQQTSADNRMHFDFNENDWKNEWVRYTTAAKDGSNWFYNNGHFCHDYAPSYKMANPVVDNWMVTRKVYQLEAGARIDSIMINNYGWMTKIQAGDTIGVYLLVGDRDPRKAKERILVFDMRGNNYKDQTDIMRKNIALPTVEGAFHVALRYRNTNTPSYWYQVLFDYVHFSGMKQTTGIDNPSASQFSATLRKGILELSGTSEGSEIRIFSAAGAQVYSGRSKAGKSTINLSGHPDGIYIVEISDGRQTVKKKIIKNTLI